MTTGPLFHVGSLENLLLAALLVKGHGVLTRSGGFDSSRVLGAMERRGVTDALLQTSLLFDALRSGAIGARALGSMRMLYTGGTDVARVGARRARRAGSRRGGLDPLRADRGRRLLDPRDPRPRSASRRAASVGRCR